MVIADYEAVCTQTKVAVLKDGHLTLLRKAN